MQYIREEIIMLNRLIKKAYIRKGDQRLDNFTINDIVRFYEQIHKVSNGVSYVLMGARRAISLFIKIFMNNRFDQAQKIIARLIDQKNIEIDPDNMGRDVLEEQVEKLASMITVQELAAAFDNNALDDLFRIFMQILTGSGGYSISSFDTKMGKSFLHFIASNDGCKHEFIRFVYLMAKDAAFYSPELYDQGLSKDKRSDEARKNMRNRNDIITDKFDNIVNDDVIIDSRNNTLDKRSTEWQNKSLYPEISSASTYNDQRFSQGTFMKDNLIKNRHGIAWIDGNVRENPIPETALNAWKNINKVEPRSYCLGYLTPDRKVFLVSANQYKGSIDWNKVKNDLKVDKIYVLMNDINEELIKTRRLAKKIFRGD